MINKSAIELDDDQRECSRHWLRSTRAGDDVEVSRSSVEVSRSSAKVEYRGMAHTTCQMTWLKTLLPKLGSESWSNAHAL